MSIPLILTSPGGGSTTPGGNNGDIQFNNNGVLGGEAVVPIAHLPGQCGALIPSITVPVLGNFTWGNQGDATSTVNSGGGVALAWSVSPGVRHLYVAVPGGSWTYSIAMSGALLASTGGYGIAMRESATGKLVMFFFYTGGPGLYTQKYTNYTTFLATYKNTTAGQPLAPALFFRVTYTSGSPGTYNWYYSIDGNTWTLFDGPRNQNDFFTTGADQIGPFVINLGGAGNNLATWIHSVGPA